MLMFKIVLRRVQGIISQVRDMKRRAVGWLAKITTVFTVRSEQSPSLQISGSGMIPLSP